MEGGPQSLNSGLKGAAALAPRRRWDTSGCKDRGAGPRGAAGGGGDGFVGHPQLLGAAEI